MKEPKKNPYAAYEKPDVTTTSVFKRVRVREVAKHGENNVYSIEFKKLKSDSEDFAARLMRMGCVTMTREEAVFVVHTLSKFLSQEETIDDLRI